jgi:gliding motility-associated-like protein
LSKRLRVGIYYVTNMKISTTNAYLRRSTFFRNLWIPFSFFLSAFHVFSQQHPLFTEGFETGASAWILDNVVSENQWVVGECAGNGLSSTGMNSLFVSDGSIEPCGNAFLYSSSLGSVNSIVAKRMVDAFCGSNLVLQFDYFAGGNSEDFAEVVYSVDGGITWIVPAGGAIPISIGWNTMTVDLPGSLENTSFLLGFRFNYNDLDIDNPSVAIDNVVLFADDNEPPVMGCPLTYTVYTNELSCEQLVPDLSKVLLSLSDNCTDSVNVMFNQFPGPIDLSGHLDDALITLEAIDLAGNTSSCQITVVLVDTVRPTLSCPFDFSVDRNLDCQYLVEDYSSLISSSDNCTLSGELIYQQTPTVGAILGSNSSEMVMVEITDAAGNTGSCEFQITLVDNIPPSLTCPQNQIVYANTSCDGELEDYLPLALFSDNCTEISVLTVNQSPGVGSFISTDQVVVITVVDENFNSVNCNFIVELIDTLNPNIICPLTQTLLVSSGFCEQSLPNYEGLTLLSDNCAGPYTELQSPLPGTMVAIGPHTVTMTAIDASGNSLQCTFTVNVIDDINPVIDACPQDQVVYADLTCIYEYDDFTGLVSGTDNCTLTQDLLFVQSPAPMDLHAGPGINEEVTISVFDESGNSASCSFFVELLDTVSPVIVCGVDLFVSADSGCEYILPDLIASATATDNCTAQGGITKTQLPAAGSLLGLGSHLVTLTATDLSGNSSQCTFQISVVDNQEPTIIQCAPNTSVNADPEFCFGSLGNYTNLVNANDNCTSSFDLIVTQSPIPGTVITSNQTVQLTVSDVSGNSSICSFNVALVDVSPPVIQCTTSVQASIVSNCDYLIPDVMQFAVATDNCSENNLIYSQVPTVGSLSGGVTNVTVTVTDAGGNTASCIAQVLPLDLIPPTVVCPSDQVVDNGVDCEGILSNYTGAVSVTDNCSGWTLSQSPLAGMQIQSGANLITMTVVDIGGNESSCTFELLLFENVSPEITCPDEIETCNPQVVYSAPAGTDNCVAVVTQTDASGLTSGDSFPIGTTVQTYTVTDPSGNSAQCSFNVTVLEYPDAAVVEADFSLCAVTSAVISANEPQTGSGLWTVITGGGQLNNQFAATTGVNNLSIGLNELVWTISTAACGQTSDTLRIIVYELPLPASVVDTVYACNLQFVQVSGNQPSAGSGLWTDPSGNATFSDPNSVPTSVFNLQEGWNDIVWTITNGSCPPSSDTVRIYKSEQARILTPDEQPVVLCLDNNVLDVTGNAGAPGVESFWSFVVGEGIFSDPFSPETSISDIRYGENTLVYRLKKQQCPPTYDTLQIVVNVCGEYGVFPNMITPNGDGQNDVWVLNNIGAIYPEVVVRVFNRWGNLVFESEGYTQNWDGTHNGEPLPMGTYYYVIELNDAASTVYKGHVSIIY